MRYYDPQNGKINNTEHYFKDAIDKQGCRILRVDNLQPNPYVMQGILRPSGTINPIPALTSEQKAHLREIVKGDALWRKYGLYEGEYKNMRELCMALHTTKSSELIRVQRQIIADKSFKPISGMENVWSSINESDDDYERLVTAAKKAVTHGYKVFIMPNPQGIKSPDWMLVKNGFIGGYDVRL